MTVYRKIYKLGDFNRREILRYSGVKEPDSSLEKLLYECMKMCGGFSGGVCFCRVPVKISEEGVDLGFTRVKSSGLAKNLRDCDEAIVFAATVGAEIDRLTEKYNRIDIAKAVFLQAIGAERIESLCDKFCRELEREQFRFM